MRKRYKFNQEIVLKRKRVEKNEFNLNVENWEYHTIIENGYIDKISSEMINKGDRVVDSSTHLLICDFSDIQSGDKIVIGNEYYMVNDVYNPMMANKHLEVELEYINHFNEQPKNYIYYGGFGHDELKEEDVHYLNSTEVDDFYTMSKLSLVNEYLYVLHSDKYNTATIRLNDIVDQSFVVTQMIVNGDNYYVYRSKTPLLGKYKLELTQ